MTGDVVNLRLARKRKARVEAEAAASANRTKFGRSKQEKQLTGAIREIETRRIEGNRVESKRIEGKAPQDGSDEPQ